MSTSFNKLFAFLCFFLLACDGTVQVRVDVPACAGTPHPAISVSESAKQIDGSAASVSIPKRAVFASSYPYAYPVGPAGGGLSGTYPNPTVSGAPPTGSAGGDLSGSYPNPTVAQLQGRPMSASAPSSTNVIAWNGSAWAPAAASGTSVTGSGLWHSIAGTLQSAAFLGTAGQIPIVNAAGTDIGYASCTGDIGCSTATPGLTTVKAITGPTPILVTPATIEFQPTTAAPTFGVATQTTDVAPPTFTVQCPNALASASTNITGGDCNIAGGAGATSNATFVPGNINLNLQVPSTAGTNEAYVQVRRGASPTTIASIGLLVGSSSTAALYGPVTRSSTNYMLAMTTAGSSQLNWASGQNLSMGAAGAVDYRFTSTSASFFNSSTSTYGASQGINIGNSSTQTTSNPTSGFLYSFAGAETWRGSGGTTTTTASTGAGTVNSQHAFMDWASGYGETASAAALTIITYTPANTSTEEWTVRVVGRITATSGCSGSTIGDSYVTTINGAAKTISSTVTIVGTATALNTQSDTSMSTTSVAVSGSTSTLLVKITPPGTCVIDWQADMVLSVN